MYYGNIKYFDIANGEGVRTSLFVSGCRNHCKECFQPETWDFKYGQLFTPEVAKSIVESLKEPYIQGFTVLGGEPFEEENQPEVTELLKEIKANCPSKDIWCYTGYVLDKDLTVGGKKHTEYTDELLSYIDVLVDGPFILEKKNISLAFRGSENQRVIDMNKYRELNKIVLYLE